MVGYPDSVVTAYTAIGASIRSTNYPQIQISAANGSRILRDLVKAKENAAVQEVEAPEKSALQIAEEKSGGRVKEEPAKDPVLDGMTRDAPKRGLGAMLGKFFGGHTS